MLRKRDDIKKKGHGSFMQFSIRYPQNEDKFFIFLDSVHQIIDYELSFDDLKVQYEKRARSKYDLLYLLANDSLLFLEALGLSYAQNLESVEMS